MRFMILVKASKESEAGTMPNKQILTESGQIQRGAGEGRRAARGRGAASELQGHTDQILRREKNRNRRAVCRD
jgi:hypothetical protein